MKRRALAALLAIAAGCSGEIRFSGDPSDSGAGSSETGARCNVDGDCLLDGLHCDPTAHVCVPCVVDADCTDAKLKACDAATHQCVECGTASDCDADQTCIPTTNECVPTCSLAHPTCPATAPSCDTARGICVGCSKDAECAAGDRPRCELASGRCVGCLSSADCRAPSKPLCDVVGECVSCLTSADCLATAPFCDPTIHHCVAK